MMKFSHPILLLFVAAALWSCGGRKETDELSHHHHSHDHGHEGHRHDHGEAEDHDDEDAIVIDPTKARQLGIATASVTKTTLTEAIKVSGEVSVPAGSRMALVANTPGILTLNPGIEVGTNLTRGQVVGYISGEDIAGGDLSASLRTDYEAARRELERLRPLYEKGVVAAKEFNAARTAFDKASVALGKLSAAGTGTPVKAPQGGTLFSLGVANGTFVEAGQEIGAIGDRSQLTLRADLPKRLHAKAPLINDAFIIPSCGDCAGFLVSDNNGHRRAGDSGVGANMSGFLPIYFTFNNNGSIESGGYVDVYLRLNRGAHVLAVPDGALFEQQGQWFVFVKLDDDCYEKRPVTKGGGDGSLTEIASGVKEGEEVVVEGVTFVKLAESASAVPEGHSHTH